ncbi:MAG: HAD family hydrolase [Clostridium sp.]|nr:HAD family hydrolase [Clostridium sp.]MCM1171965.1 HAD family hydrolase [Clostridium sp.]
MSFKAVVFDMDGVIFDTEKLYRKYQLQEGEKRGIPAETMHRACERIAGGNKHTNKKPFEDIVGRGIDYFEFREHVMENLDRHIRQYGVDMKEGVAELLPYLKEKGIKIGLATSTAKKRATEYLQAHHIYEYFDQLIFGDMLEHGKPAPDIYLKACEMLQVLPVEAIAVEDSLNGIRSAGAAGMYPVMVIDLIQPNDEIKPYLKKVYHSIIQLKEIV